MSSTEIVRPELRDQVNETLNGYIKKFYTEVPYATHFLNAKEVDMAYYKRHTIETILRIRRKRTIDAHAIHYFTLHNPAAAKEWAEYTDDEMLHDKLFLADLERLGVGPDEVYSTDPFLATKLLNGYFLYCQEFEGTPLAAIASSYFLEYTTRMTQPDWLDNLESTMGKDEVRGARTHVNYDIDEDHTGDVWNTLMTLVKDDADVQRLLKHFEQLYQLFTMYFVEAYQATRPAAEKQLAGAAA
ncbi:iron-containing redox enzyme family protein [Streptomyces sp. NPDC047123]|uniref:iron-containing redox enzyme family protein n=1 Tax=Streptomyces sp. NPDC047123 TaxID=3155622 RepID=UPI003403EE39